MARSRFARGRRSGALSYASPRVGQSGTVSANPIPVGVYWVDAIGEPAQAELSAWLEAWALPRLVDVVRSEYSPGGWLEGLGGVPSSEWVLFEVTAPVPRWTGATGLGLPTVAPRGRATQKGDTVQRPPPEKDPLDTLGETTLGVPTWAWVAGGLVTLGVVVFAASR